jgi:hypothetical protein
MKKRLALSVLTFIFMVGPLAMLAPWAAGDTDLGKLKSISNKGPGDEVSWSSPNNDWEMYKTDDGTYYAKHGAGFAPCLPQTIPSGQDFKYTDATGDHEVKEPFTGQAKNYQNLQSYIDSLVFTKPPIAAQMGTNYYQVPVPQGIQSAFLSTSPALFGNQPQIAELLFFGLESTPTLMSLVASTTPSGPPQVFTYDPTVFGLTLNSNGDLGPATVTLNTEPNPTIGTSTDLVLGGIEESPEPSSLALLCVGIGALFAWTHRDVLRRPAGRLKKSSLRFPFRITSSLRACTRSTQPVRDFCSDASHATGGRAKPRAASCRPGQAGSTIKSGRSDWSRVGVGARRWRRWLRLPSATLLRQPFW